MHACVVVCLQPRVECRTTVLECGLESIVEVGVCAQALFATRKCEEPKPKACSEAGGLHVHDTELASLNSQSGAILASGVWRV